MTVKGGASLDGIKDRAPGDDRLLVVDMVPSHLWCLTPEGEPVFFNKRMVEFLGLDVSDTCRPGMRGLDVMIESIVHPDDAGAFRKAIDRSLETGDGFEMRYRLRRWDGVYRWMSSRAEPMLDANGKIVQWYGTCHDIDDQERASDQPPSLGFVHPDDRAFAAQAMAYAFWTGVPQIVTCRQRQPDESYLQAELRLDPGYGVSVDVEPMVFKPDKRWSVPESFGETIHAVRAAKVIESLHGKAWALDAGGSFVYVTPSAQTAIGMTLRDLNEPVRGGAFIDGGDVGWSRGVHPEDYPEAAASLRHCLKTGEHWNVEYRMLRTSGHYVWHRISARPTRNTDGRITGWFGTSIDIDIYKRTEEKLRERQRELAQIVDMVPVHIRRLTPQGEPTFFNKRLIDFFGLDLPDLERPGESRLPTVIHALVHPDDSEVLLKAVRHSVATGEPYSMKYRLRRADGVYRWVDGRAEPIRDRNGEIVHWYAISIDVDEEMRAQEALREREQELLQLVNMVPSLLWRLNAEGEPVYFSKRTADFLGVDIDDSSIAGTSRLSAVLASVVHPDDVSSLEKELGRCIVGGEAFSMNYRLRRADGVYRWMSGRAEPMRDEEGRIVQWYGLSHDIEDRMAAEDALRESERSLRQLVETLPAMIDCAAPDGEPIYRSRQLREFLGYNLEYLDGNGKSRLAGTLDAGVHPDDLAGVKERYAHSLTTGEPYSRKHRLRRFDGEYRWVDTRAAPMRNAEGTIVQWNVICLDIDGEVRAQEELRLAQENLARASQTARLSELSASIAHEVNQPLAAIVANSHACHRWLSANPPNVDRAKVTAERIIRDANSAADVISRIRALFRQAPQTGMPENLNHLFSEVQRLMADEIAAKGIRVKTSLDPDLPPVVLDRVQMQQVFLNLIRNGIEAMESVPAGARVLNIRSVPDGSDTIRVELSDNGTGFQDTTAVFEPFFTTKRDGMGMGLAICRSIIEAHGGRLWADNNEAAGATVIFTLPVRERPVELRVPCGSQ